MAKTKGRSSKKPVVGKRAASKSDFIRSQPTGLSRPELIKRAKAAGMKLSSQLVYAVRARLARPKAKKPATTEATSKAPAKPTTSKAAFVRSQPASIPARAVIAQARAAGMKLSTAYVYIVRAAAKENRSSVRAGRSVPRPIATPSLTENLLRAVAAELGLGPAIETLSGERAKVRAVIRG